MLRGGVAQRRWLGGAVLGAALLMLILGQTVLQRRLQGLFFLIYWLVCLALTGLAILVALVDARATRIELQRQNRQLLERTVKDIQHDAEARQRKGRLPRRFAQNRPPDIDLHPGNDHS